MVAERPLVHRCEAILLRITASVFSPNSFVTPDDNNLAGDESFSAATLKNWGIFRRRDADSPQMGLFLPRRSNMAAYFGVVTRIPSGMVLSLPRRSNSGGYFGVEYLNLCVPLPTVAMGVVVSGR